MSTCEITTGIFLLTHCGKTAKIHCQDCGKPACSRHSVQRREMQLCLPCAARRQKAKYLGQKGQPWLHDAEETELQYFLIRETFQEHFEHQPFVLSDFVAFDHEGIPEMEESNEAAPTFFDS